MMRGVALDMQCLVMVTDDYEDDGRKYNNQLQECNCPSFSFPLCLTCIKDTRMSVSDTKY